MFSPGMVFCLHFKFFFNVCKKRRIHTPNNKRCSHRDWSHVKYIPTRRKNADITHWILKQRAKSASLYGEARRILTPTTTGTHAHNTHHYLFIIVASKQPFKNSRAHTSSSPVPFTNDERRDTRLLLRAIGGWRAFWGKAKSKELHATSLPGVWRR